MNIKAKLNLGIGVLFSLILILGIVSTAYINALKADTENILTANYNSMEYCRNMLINLEDKTDSLHKPFIDNLYKQQHNITEKGEKEITDQLSNSFAEWLSNQQDSAMLPFIRSSIFTLMDMNMQALQLKSEMAKHTAETATFWIALCGCICFLIAFTLLINLPATIANPIKELTESIKQIAAGNYSSRVHFETHDEFGDLALSFNTMAQKLEEYNHSNLAILMMEKKRIETLINNMHDPVVGLDENKKMIFANEEAAKIIGLRQQQIIGKSAVELSVSNDLIRSLIQDLMPVTGNRENTLPQKPTISIYADGKESYFEKETHTISIIPTGESMLKSMGTVIILRNVTSYKELDFAKTKFIATVSHEFKTPIASIKMSLQLLENDQIGHLNEEQKHLVNSITDDTNRLLKITGELLHMTQAETGNIQLSVEPAIATNIVQYAIDANKMQAEQKKISIQLNAKHNLPKVLADTDKTTWVLTNLISNAIRYSYENAVINIDISVVNKWVHFAVKDTGNGIPPQYLEKLFDRYFQVPGSKKGGTGLGLAICKEFIEAQGGQILVESDYGAGSTFTVILQMAAE